MVTLQPLGNDEVNHGGDGGGVYDEEHLQRNIEPVQEAGYSKLSHVRTHSWVKELKGNVDSAPKSYHHRSSQSVQNLMLSQHFFGSDSRRDSKARCSALGTAADVLHDRNVYHRSDVNLSINVL